MCTRQWHCHKAKEEGLEQAKQVAEEWYIGLRGKDKVGILLNEKTFKFAAERFTMEYGLVTEGHRSQKWTEGHAIRLRVHLLPFFGNIGLSPAAEGYKRWQIVNRRRRKSASRHRPDR